MRGSGYAIGEILIFLAIAAIIGFLIGWVVFYRRPDKAGQGLSTANPNHVRRLEERARTADAKVVRFEKQANLLLESLSKAAPAKAAAPEAAAPRTDGKATKSEDDKAADAKPDEDKVPNKPESDKAAEAKPDEGKPADAKPAPATVKSPGVPTAEQSPEAPAKEPETGDDEVGDYLSEADDRISKLEETLDKLGAKLAELEDD